MTAISLADWGPLMDAGATTYAVGPAPAVAAVYLDRAEAAAAADELRAPLIEWDGHTGHQVEYEADVQADVPGPGLEIEA